MSGIFSYNKITPEIISEIESKIGAHNVSAEAEKLESYSHDEVFGSIREGLRRYGREAV